ncbi:MULTISPECIES: double-strand break repair protein AddB [Agrobacterium]|uniref:Double-strand break repair protein AddB n=1 Tax=Agrobacterium tumefaciens str. Kerr 14 TaxID=1183424 RepID=A0A1S7PK55_AGRTU|nr:double-strand break repair protein AddB [Agrobacterium tumefaciens]AYM82496.1 exonuclease RecB [Agrobacterium tumefaciens]EHH06655.1 double-strand break repair protein AddB [Agrobacterium tumefaciens CCNWGS0286]MBP2535258.1 ATP-dependent helicase/nuclease subunit B [Agrobacterium tumefaciens]MDP9874701.1 ATP-dependent helicase/nuclease subunit B [Agrobacterium tumefaciens]MDP9979676.1 ATP-dependent helicase/nuclease subunit B [Agrobacterium tumefaciens]
MTLTHHAKRVLTIAAGTPFLRTLAETLCDGTLTSGYKYDPADPLSLAKVTIYVPTRRSARVLRSEFVDLLGGRSAILPLIRPLGETDDDSGFFEIENPEIMDLAPPISGTGRLIELARLILAWRNSLPDAIRAIHSDSPLVAPASPADAIWLARALGEVIDAMDTEEKDWEALQHLDTGDHAQWWQLTADFLRIASVFWPARLAELNRSSAGRHRNAILRAEANRLANLPDTGPIIVAGSTGSIPAAADLIAAVAALPQGTVVLPGLDLAMPEEQWQAIAEDPTDPSSRTHSQYGLYMLLQKLGILRDDVDQIGAIDGDLEKRAAVFSAALAPAKSTSDWNRWREDRQPGFFDDAFATATLIEAANEREEATAIAVALRLALEAPGAGRPSQAALITPDRGLARRVATELQRFGIEADDSAGTPLSATPQAGLTQLALEAILRPGDPVPIISLLKHPLSRFGLSDEAFAKASKALELIALRGGRVETEIGNLEAVLDAQLVVQRDDRHPPAWRLALPQASAEAGRDLARRIAVATEPLGSAFIRRDRSGRAFTDKLPLSVWAERTGRVIEAICADENNDLAALWSGEAGDKLSELFGELMESGEILDADGPQWIDIFAALVAGESIKPRSMRHPRIFIFGALEARLQSVDTVVIGGLNEGLWPGQTANNPFLSRTMKTAIGLEPPERRIGQLAHDFEMANGTRQIFYTRALRQGSTPAVASRWLQRLLALGGEKFAESLKKRGETYRHWAGLMDESIDQEAAKRPAPKPPAELQPTRYSFSEVGRLRRDPYSIYARRILKLDPLAPFNRDPNAADRGTLYHAIIERYSREAHIPGTPASLAAMQRILDECFDAENLPPHVDVIWRPRFAAVARAFIDWEKERHPSIRHSFFEARAGQEIAEAGIRLTGIADRIDIKTNGHADIIDYKTGLAPSVNQARALLDPQLALEAAALMRGAFREAGSPTPDNLIYVRLRPGERFFADQVNNEHSSRSSKRPPKSAIELATESIEQLTKFVHSLREGENGFASRLVPEEQQSYGGEYDHLARVSEWSTAEPGDGDDD